MKPDSVEWWYDQAKIARDLIRDDNTPDRCCLFALATGRCKLLGKSLKWPFPIKKAVAASESLITIMADYKSRLADVGWLAKIMPEKLKDVTPGLLNRRIDILGVQVMLDIAFDEMDVRHEEIVNETTDTVVNALLDVDAVLEKVFPVLKSLGDADKLLDFHRSRIISQYHDQWWLSGTIKGKSK